MAQNKYTLGKMFQVLSTTSVITTNPNCSQNRTITHVDHKKIAVGEILLLIDYFDLGISGIWVWLYYDSVVWQVMEKNNFKKCWRLL